MRSAFPLKSVAALAGVMIGLFLHSNEINAAACPSWQGDWAQSLTRPSTPPPEKLTGKSCSKGSKLVGKPPPKGAVQTCQEKQTGKENGAFLVWHDDGRVEQGSLLVSGNFKSRKGLDGTHQYWNKNGKLIGLSQWRSGKLTGLPLYWQADGTLDLAQSIKAATHIKKCDAWETLRKRFPNLSDEDELLVRESIAQNLTFDASVRRSHWAKKDTYGGTLFLGYHGKTEALLRTEPISCSSYPKLCYSRVLTTSEKKMETQVVAKGLEGTYAAIPTSSATQTHRFTVDGRGSRRIMSSTEACEIGQIENGLRVGIWLRVNKCRWLEDHDKNIAFWCNTREKNPKRCLGTTSVDRTSLFDLYTKIQRVEFKEQIPILLNNAGATLITYSGSADPLPGGPAEALKPSEAAGEIWADHIARQEAKSAAYAKHVMSNIDACFSGVDKRAAGRPYVYLSATQRRWPDLKPEYTMLGWGECNSRTSTSGLLGAASSKKKDEKTTSIKPNLQGDFEKCREFKGRKDRAFALPGVCLDRALPASQMLQPDPKHVAAFQAMSDRCKQGDDIFCQHLNAYVDLIEYRLVARADHTKTPDCDAPLKVELKHDAAYVSSEERQNKKYCRIFSSPFSDHFSATSPRTARQILEPSLKQCMNTAKEADDRIAGCLAVAGLKKDGGGNGEFGYPGGPPSIPKELATACELGNSFACNFAIDMMPGGSKHRTSLTAMTCEKWKKWCPRKSRYSNMSPCAACRTQSMDSCCTTRTGNTDCTWGVGGQTMSQHFKACQREANRDCSAMCR